MQLTMFLNFKKMAHRLIQFTSISSLIGFVV